jgi:predicted amidohydrolase
MKPKEFKLALVQMQVKGGDRAWNIHHAVDLISEAASNGADVALLPECMDLGWTHPSSLTMAEEIPDGEVCKALIQVAKQNAIYVCSGLTEKAGDQVFNSAVILDKYGEVLCKHRKLNELEIGHEYYAQGDRLNVVRTEFGTLGVMICADGFAKDHVLSRSLCYMGADVILSPSAWAVPGDHDNTREPYGDTWRNSYMPVAKEFSTAIFGVSNVGSITDGPWKGRKCIGCSLAISSSGKEILQGPYGIDAECILYIDVQPTQRPARRTGWNSGV